MFHMKCELSFPLVKSPLFLRTGRTIPKLVTPVMRGRDDEAMSWKLGKNHFTRWVIEFYPNHVGSHHLELSNVG